MSGDVGIVAGGADGWLDQVKAAVHGRQSLIDERWTESKYLAAKAGRILQQGDGARVYIAKAARNSYNVVIEDDRGVVTAMKGVTRQELDNLTANYGWRYP